MKKFKYHSPKSLDESRKIFMSCEFPQYLAGGMTLLPSIKQGISSPTDLIDLAHINDMKGINEDNNNISVGSLVNHNEIAKSYLIKKYISGLAYLASKIADNAVRNKGTLGGSICNADPAADYPGALISLNAKVVTNSREIEARDFFIDMFETILEEGEIVTKIIFPKATYSSYEKFSSQASKYAIVGVFFSVLDKKASIAITGAANKVFLIDEIEGLNINELQNFNLDNINFSNYDINSDINAGYEYRISLIKSLIKKSLANLHL